MWLLWQLLSNQKKITDNNFEYRLILEYEDKPPMDIDININAVENEHDLWLRLVRTNAPFSSLNNIDISNNENASLCISCFIDLDKLLKIEPLLNNIYLWTATSEKREQIYLETICFEAVYSLKKPKVRSLNANKNFVELYPILSNDNSTDRYEQIENQRIDSEGLTELLALIVGDTAEINTVDPIEQPTTDLDPSHPTEAYAIETRFSKQDLKYLREGFHAWQRAHGKNEMVDMLPESLLEKMGDEYDIAFWTSGQDISNMVRDHNPPRHTMVLSIIQKSNQQGLGYCIQRPTSLDRVWTHKRWHNITCSDTEILEVAALER